MSEASKIKVLTGLVVILIIVNVISLGYIWCGAPAWSQHGHRGGRGPAGLVPQELQFDARQQAQFETLRGEHHAAMQAIGDQDRKLHDELFRSLTTGADTSAYADSLIHRIAMLRIENEQITYKHLAEVRRICSPAQRQKFDKMIADAMAQNARGQGPPDRRP
ncbi:MAG: periplasmic heavy metal sensor [Bacteroidetes bacterium]|nr:periplasmic heavy metal sensor [Bacteroidota bacterium]MBS1685767.1 periplasmic heavy metal sensor [Bacteroidota bacterium]